MLDLGLLVTAAVILAVLWAAASWAPVDGLAPGRLIDLLALPALVGLVVARATAAWFDDPASLRSVRSFLVISGGVEFWAGVLAGGFLLLWAARQRPHPTQFVLALTPHLLWAYAAFEATCLFRDGCYGPPSPFGLVPAGLQTRVLPVGLAVAAAVASLAAVLRRVTIGSPVVSFLVGLGLLALVRSAASVWLPDVARGWSRAQLESVLVAGSALSIAALLTAARRRRSAATVGSRTGTDVGGITQGLGP